MAEKNQYALSADERRRIRGVFERTAEKRRAGAARKERARRDILHGDVPTFMELPLARRPEDLAGADAAIVGFGYEGITITSPSESAPPTISRPEPGSVYWRMGADLAPDAIRRYSLYYSMHHNGGYYPEIDRDLVLFDLIKAVDYGNVDVIVEDTVETMRRASEKVGDVVDADAFPIVLGGDHTIPYPSLRAILERRSGRVGLIIFDAHIDFSYTPDDYWASNQWPQLIEETGKINPSNVVEIGIRSNRNALEERRLAEELGVRIYAIDEVKSRGMREVVTEAIGIAGDGTDGIYVSLDIDVMEPGLVPAQKAPEFWGLTIDELMWALQIVSREHLVGYDVCELSPNYDVNGMGAQFCARTVVEILGGLALRKRDGS
jgi:arginase family enzyme